MSVRFRVLLSCLLLVAVICGGCAPKRLAPSTPAHAGDRDPGPGVRRPADPVPRGSGPGAEAAALAYAQLGVPYRYGGATASGFDCSGLVQYVYLQLGVGLPRTVRAQVKSGRSVKRDDLLPGDLVFFDTGAGRASHVGIYLSDSTFIHAPSSGGRVRTDAMTDAYWHRSFVAARRIIPSR